MMDRLTVQVQDTVNALRSLGTLDVFSADLDSAEKLVTDANNSRQVCRYQGLYSFDEIFQVEIVCQFIMKNYFINNY